MRLVPVLSAICLAASLSLSGCGESPFALAPRPNPDSIIVEINDDDKVLVNYKSVPSVRLAEVLNDLGRKHQGRPVTLVVHEKTHPNAIPYAKKAAHDAGLGKVTVMQRNPKGSFRSRPQEKAPEETAAKTAAPAPDAPVAAAETTAAPAPAPAVAPPAAAPVAAAEPPPPATPAPAPATLSVHAKQGDGSAPTLENTVFVIDGKPVAYADLPAALREIGAANPGKNVEFSRDSGVSAQALSHLYRAARDAGLGNISAKAK